MENLSEMVKNNTEPVVFSKENLDLPVEPVAEETQATEVEAQEENIVEETPAEELTEGQIGIIALPEWFDQNIVNFHNIKKVTVSITGVDSNEQLIVTIPDPTDDNLGKRKLIVFNDVYLTPVLNFPAIDMQVYTNGFRVLHEYSEGTYIKSYGARSSLTSVFCIDVDDILIPYKIIKARKKDRFIQFEAGPTADIIRERMQEEVDMESLTLLYKQSTKVTEGFTTKGEAIAWLLQRQGGVTDVNHHLQIDNVIISLLF